MNRKGNLFRLALLLSAIFLMPVVSAWGAETRLTWHGHAAFEIVTPGGAVLVIDPWLKNPVNPNAQEEKDPLALFQKADYLLITHGHMDHVGDSVALAKKTGARLVTNAELGGNMVKLLGFPKEQVGFDTFLNIGGEIEIAKGEVTVVMTPAVHSSGLGNPNAGPQEADIVYGGNPGGFIVIIKNGPTIYHTGDTAYFGDMALIGQHAPDVALINIGGHFGMSPAMAAKAAATVKAKLAIPHHFGTMPILTQDPKPFVDALGKEKIPARVMKPGQTVVFEGKKLKK
ncbi:MAG: metal-dependent hydrolase [Candidatus Manganitrophus sp. SB1]|nr:metal-dependent hydrolase [Candidatus Manganitrophus morganii]